MQKERKNSHDTKNKKKRTVIIYVKQTLWNISNGEKTTYLFY